MCVVCVCVSGSVFDTQSHTHSHSQRKSKAPLSFLLALAAVPFCITGAGNYLFVTAIYRLHFPSPNPHPPGYRPSYSEAVHLHLRSLCVYMFDWVCRWLEGVFFFFQFLIIALVLHQSLCVHVYLFFVCFLSCLSQYLSHRFCGCMCIAAKMRLSALVSCVVSAQVCVCDRKCSPRVAQHRLSSGRPV